MQGYQLNGDRIFAILQRDNPREVERAILLVKIEELEKINAELNERLSTNG